MKTDEVFSAAIKVLREGGVILYPTDTVWGLGCDATRPDAVARIFDIKRRPDSKSLVLLASDLDMVARYVKAVPGIAVDLVEVNDAPMTIIYPGAIAGDAPADGDASSDKGDKHLLAWNAVAADGTVGIRVPLHDFCKELVRKLGRPLVSTSANISGEPSPVSRRDIAPEIVEAVDYVVPAPLEKGATGKPSQIIKVGLDAQVEIIRK